MGLLILFGMFLPHSIECMTRADMIELNHVYRGDGRWFTQWVVWDWYHDQFHVRDWSLEGKRPYRGQSSSIENIYVYLRKKGGEVELTRRDALGRYWVVEAFQFRETWTLEDVEVEDRSKMPMSQRRLIWSRRSSIK